MKSGIKILLGTLALTSSAYAKNKIDSEFEIGKPAEMKPVVFEADYNIGLIHNDNGLLKTDGGDDPAKDTTIAVDKFRIQFRGALDNDIGYRVRYDVNNEQLDFAYIRWFINNEFTISAGRGWVAQGGTAYFSSSLSRYYLPQAYMVNLPFDPYKEMFQFDYLNKSIGNFTLQVFDDSVKRDSLRVFDQATSINPAQAAALDALLTAIKQAGGNIGSLSADLQQAIAAKEQALGIRSLQLSGHARNYQRWNNGSGSPTFALMYISQLFDGVLKPMVQYGSYDYNHSSWYSVGGILGFDKLTGFFSYTSESRSSKITETDGKTKDEFDTLTNIDLELKFAATERLTPYVFYSKYDRKEGAETQIKGNLPVDLSSTFGEDGISPWTDNGVTLAAGVEYMVNEHLNIYGAYYSVSGDFFKSTTSAETETKTQNELRVGLFGKY